MAGGIGSRFWPMSTPERPKQFLDMLGTGKSLIRMTYDRMKLLCPPANIYIITNEQYKDLVLEQIPELEAGQVLTEPIRKNTAPCIAYAASKIHSIDPEATLIITPADHLIVQEEEFKKTLVAAVQSAGSGRIATIGIKPTRPDTGYGYIEFQQANPATPNQVLPVIQFREKPDLTTAESFLASGNFYWNSGIFIWKSITVLESLKSFQPELFNLFCKDLSLYNTSSEEELKNNAFHVCEDISIDFAVMEHAKNIDVVLATFDWSDLGTWGSLKTHIEADAAGNSVIGKAAFLFNSSNCLVNLEEGHQAIIDGLEGYIVVLSDQKLLIIRQEKEQELKKFQEKIKQLK